MKKTIVLGASTNPARYSYTATMRLKNQGFETIPVGIKKGDIEGLVIQNGTPDIEGVDTITLYMNPQRQKPFYDYIIGLKPKRIIFNPGTENPVLMNMAREAGIETVVACTLVMLATGEY